MVEQTHVVVVDDDSEIGTALCDLLSSECYVFFFSSRRRHTRCGRDWSSDVCSSDLSSTPVGTLSLREERLVARKELEQVGEVVVRTEVDEVPGRLEVEALREEVEVEHQPLGQVVSERREPWEDRKSVV